MNKKLILLLIIIIAFCNLNAQNSEEQSYFPLKKGMSKTLTWYKEKYREVIKDTVKFNGKTYTKVSQIFPKNNEMSIYLRNSNDTIYFYNQKSKKERVFFGISTKKGEK